MRGAGQVAVRVAREGSLLVLGPDAADPVLAPLARKCLSFQVTSLSHTHTHTSTTLFPAAPPPLVRPHLPGPPLTRPPFPSSHVPLSPPCPPRTSPIGLRLARPLQGRSGRPCSSCRARRRSRAASPPVVCFSRLLLPKMHKMKKWTIDIKRGFSHLVQEKHPSSSAGYPNYLHFSNGQAPLKCVQEHVAST